MLRELLLAPHINSIWRSGGRCVFKLEVLEKIAGNGTRLAENNKGSLNYVRA